MITVLAYIILIFTGLQFLIALINLITRNWLPETKTESSKLVSVLIPARDEEKNIGNILNDLSNQSYQDIEVIVCNDQSEDNTASIVSAYAARDGHVRLINSEGPAEGWTGKNYACHLLSKHARGEYLLFLDADVRLKGNIIGNAAASIDKNGIGLISIFPRQIIESFGERITVPNMNYILLSLLPLPLVRRPKYPSLSAANGQFMFFDASVYHSTKPHSLVKNNRVEDIHIARNFKKQGIKISCLLGNENISCRMYNGFRESVNGFSKNVVAFFGNSYLLAVLFWLVTTFGIIPVLISFSIKILILYLILYFITRSFISLASRQNIFYNLINFIFLQFSLGAFIYKSLINKYRGKLVWKGRIIK
jgi:cellulose synthase/poly-beta-1,6-N-acetylglucosamine synthase-like glycosyltransferase